MQVSEALICMPAAPRIQLPFLALATNGRGTCVARRIGSRNRKPNDMQCARVAIPADPSPHSALRPFSATRQNVDRFVNKLLSAI